MKFVTLDKLPFRDLKEGVRQKAVWGENIMISHMEMAPVAEIPDHHDPGRVHPSRRHGKALFPQVNPLMPPPSPPPLLAGSLSF